MGCDTIAANRTDCLYKMDIALNKLQRFICHKTHTTLQPNSIGMKNQETCIIIMAIIMIIVAVIIYGQNIGRGFGIEKWPC